MGRKTSGMTQPRPLYGENARRESFGSNGKPMNRRHSYRTSAPVAAYTPVVGDAFAAGGDGAADAASASLAALRRCTESRQSGDSDRPLDPSPHWKRPSLPQMLASPETQTWLEWAADGGGGGCCARAVAAAGCSEPSIRWHGIRVCAALAVAGEAEVSAAQPASACRAPTLRLCSRRSAAEPCAPAADRTCCCAVRTTTADHLRPTAISAAAAVAAAVPPVGCPKSASNSPTTTPPVDRRSV